MASEYKVKVFRDGTPLGFIRWEMGTLPAVVLNATQGTRLQEDRLGAALAALGAPDEEFRNNGYRPGTSRTPVVTFQIVKM